MTTLTFDTLKFADTLKAAGVPDKQAEAQARALADAFSSNALGRQELRCELY